MCVRPFAANGIVNDIILHPGYSSQRSVIIRMVQLFNMNSAKYVLLLYMRW